jgi:acyl dehydratase
LALAIRDRYFEDYLPGEVFQFGDYPVTEQEIIEFAVRYDPQPFHTDPERARGSNFGGLIASGWMTGSIMMRLLVDHFISSNGMGSPGIDEVRWHQPVRTGDRVSVRVTIRETRRSVSKPDRGMVFSTNEAFNQRGELLMSYKGMGMYRCRS